MNPAAPPAGWYADYLSTTQLRWWDGSTWTDHTMPIPAPEPPALAVAVASQPTEFGQSWAPPAEPQAPMLRSRGAAQTPAIVPYDAFNQPSRVSDYRPMQTSFTSRVIQYGSPNTGWIWVVALILVISLTAQGIGNLTGISSTRLGAGAISLGVIVLLVIAVLRDRAVLADRNLPRASGWWLLLFPPIAYLIARRIVLRRVGVIANAPGNVYFVTWLLVVLLIGAGVAVLMQLSR
jgi:hypothetical protein